ncbi:MAG: TonB-dependent receptor, partial [Bacteroidia bacterium]|nr:TonB-dependent receptor [Bacteroidia bacterium]
MKKMIVLLFLLVSGISAAQNFTISGYVKDNNNGEAMIGVTVYEEGTNNAVVTNEYGFYSLTLKAGKHKVVYAFIGFENNIKEIDLTKNFSFDIEMKTDKGIKLEEVEVKGEKEDHNVKSMEMSVVNMDIKTIQKMPALLGEVDVIRSIQLLPGVSTVGEGSSGFNVRGGNIDQNLILLDEAPVYNSSHLFGFFSVFNPDAVKDVKLIKGGIPAEYGGRLSSILDIRMKEGNSKKLQLNGGIGTIFSRLSLEAPIKKDTSSFILAVRRSYIDFLAKPFLKGDLKKAKFNFFDITAKFNYRINNKNQIFVSGYFGQDVFGAGFKFNWGNSTGTFRWNHVFGEKLFLNLTAIYSNYQYTLGFKDESNGQAFDWTSKIINYSPKFDFTWYPNNKNKVHFGAQTILYDFQPGNAVVTSGDGGKTNISLDNKFAFEHGVYIDNEQRISTRLRIQYGIRVSAFQYMGKGYAYTFADTTPNIRKRLIEEKLYGKFEVIKNFFNPEPRISMKLDLTSVSSLKMSYNRTAQYIHLVSNTAAATPLDIWTPSTNNIKPQIADQVAIGYFRNFKDNMFETSVETYYKKMDNQLDYIDNAQLFLNKYLEAELLQGKGRAYGLELFIKKTRGKFTGWLSYTLARTERKVIGISKDQWFPSKFDRTHNLNLVANYEPNKRWNFAANFVFYTGTPATFPTSKLEIQGYTIPYNTTELRNNFRIT